MPKFSVAITIELDAPDGDEAFRIVREEYAVVHDPTKAIKSEQFHVEATQLDDGITTEAFPYRWI